MFLHHFLLLILLSWLQNDVKTQKHENPIFSSIKNVAKTQKHALCVTGLRAPIGSNQIETHWFQFQKLKLAFEFLNTLTYLA